MTSVVAAQPRSAPTAVDSGGRLVMQAAGIYREPLQKKSGTPADGIAAMLGELFQELLMAEKRIGWPCGLECFEKFKLSNCRHGNRQHSCCRATAQQSTNQSCNRYAPKPHSSLPPPLAYCVGAGGGAAGAAESFSGFGVCGFASALCGLAGGCAFGGARIRCSVLPSCRGRNSTIALSPRSVIKRSKIPRPKLWRVISRPRKKMVAFTLSPSARKRSTWFFLVS